MNENKDGEPTLWLFGTNDDAMQGGKSRTQVHTFYSSDPALGASSWKVGTLEDSLLVTNQTNKPNK